ncbi:hypothetical protein SAMN05192549_106184 [Duganella sacchari]|uniref:Haemolysin XhlA n=1 Tax=Duganella sacchari TaxID=551987 RepID=A0A1M7Q4N0_9BURK|nr:hypothetical protein [Duganella sacchari]SHN25188.1 hypothetical protein SAMN05192549_106184 [Duganella sacchari]
METEQRIDRLEDSVGDTKQRLVRIEEQLKYMATKEDVANLRGDLLLMETRMLKWFVGTAIALSATVSTIVFAITKFIH